jgi:hypothetical protein
MAERSFSHAIAEGDGISVIAAVEDAEAARAAEAQRAEALVVTRDPAAVRAGSSLPILWRSDVGPDEAVEMADAVVLVFDALDEDDGRLEELYGRALDLGLDCAVEIRDGDEVEKALDRVDPEIFVLSPIDADRDETPLEVVLDLLAAVPAGKLAIADLRVTTPDEVQELRARRLRRRDRLEPGRLAAHGGAAARGLELDAARSGGTLPGMRAWLIAAAVAAVLALVPAASSAPAAGGCPAAWRSGWQALAKPDSGARLLPDMDAEPARREDRRPVHRHQLDREGPQLPGQLPRARRRRERRRARELSRLPRPQLDPDVHHRRARREEDPARADTLLRRRRRRPHGERVSLRPVYRVNQDADQWHILLAWRHRGSLYTVSEHVIRPYTYRQVVRNLDDLLSGLVLVQPER